MWIAFLIWFLVIVAVLVAILLLARAESHRDAFSASIPDGQEYDARRAQEQEDRRGSARIVAPGIVIQPSSGAEPGATGDGVGTSSSSQAGDEPVVATSQRVVEVRGILGTRKPALVGQASQASASANDTSAEAELAPGSESGSQAGSDSDSAAASARPFDSLDALEDGLNMAQENPLSETPAVAEQPLISQEELEENAERVASIAAHSAHEDSEDETPHSVAADDLPELPLPERDKEEGSSSLANLVSKTEEKEAQE